MELSGTTPFYSGLDETPSLQRILIVDDEAGFRKSLTLLLSGTEREIVTAGSVAEATRALMEKHFDVILLDLQLPDGPGSNVLDMIANEGLHALVIVVSGDERFHVAIDALRYGVFDFLAKPYQLEHLKLVVDNALQKRRLEYSNALITAKLERSEQLHRYLVDASPDFIYTLDGRGHITFTNSRVESLLGFRKDELIGQHYSVLVHEADYDRARYAFNERRTGERASCNVEIRLRCKKEPNDYRHVSTTSITGSLSAMGMYGDMVDSNGKRNFLGTYGVARDISDRKRMESELIELNASLERRVAERTEALRNTNRELESFSYSISHDLRAPLRAINGFASILEETDRDRLSQEGQGMLKRVLANTLRMSQLIDDMLEYARTARLRLTRSVVRLQNIAQAVANELLLDYPGASITVHDLPTIHGDETMLRQVFANLIGNALKFSAKHPSPVIEVSCFNRNEEIVIYVKDNGIGFDMRYATRLFGVFQRLHNNADFPGTGVGLATVKRIIERHGGKVWAESEVNKGTTVLFTIGTDRYSN